MQYVCPLRHEGIYHVGHLLSGCLAQPDPWYTSYATPQFIQLIGQHKKTSACFCLYEFGRTYRFVGLRCNFKSLERIAVGCWVESDFSDCFGSEWRGARRVFPSFEGGTRVGNFTGFSLSLFFVFRTVELLNSPQILCACGSRSHFFVKKALKRFFFPLFIFPSLELPALFSAHLLMDKLVCERGLLAGDHLSPDDIRLSPGVVVEL